MEAVGGTPPYSWELASTPDGLDFDADGVLSGTPISAGNYDLGVRVTSNLTNLNLTGLTVLQLANNQLTGPVPASIGNLDNLGSLLLISNQLTSLPSSVGDMDSLWALQLGDNQFEALPSEVFAPAGLRQVSFWGDSTSAGAIPDQVVNATALESLNLGGTNLSGDIPVGFTAANLPNLTNLHLLTVHPRRVHCLLPRVRVHRQSR